MALTNDVTYAMRHQTFVLTGRLENYTREQAREEIQRRGGRFENRVTRDTDVLIVGDKPGATKMNAAVANRIVCRNEQWLMAAFTCNTPGFVPRQRTSTQLAPDVERENQRSSRTAAATYIAERDRVRRLTEVLSVAGYNAPSESAQKPAVKASLKVEKRARSVRID
jgi:BRCA1 C Terminus (BRCT) domain